MISDKEIVELRKTIFKEHHISVLYEGAFIKNFRIIEKFVMDRLQKNGIAYIDKYGRKWEKSSIDQIFEALTHKRKIDNILDYYAFKED